ncbi:GNAT family N-acetyltransferase [Curtobacterium aetherium]|uniref:GNAT family N-acetyltransferase n=1 Tax=Curtobacterium aetherium TaxID=2841594 RepID=A0ACD1E861_9MICO|nr:GNAT family N-acetyltransferase [Curtobacterium sp. L6-1]QWS34958.1 GNAT family N-acetyltransferase [Curtobacterium sp. L6-1]
MTTRSTAALLRHHVRGLEHLTAGSPHGRVFRAGSLAFADSGIDVGAFNAVTVTGAAWSARDLDRAAGIAAAGGRPWSVTVQRGGSTTRDAARLHAVERVAAAHGLTERDEDPFLVCLPASFRPAGPAGGHDAGEPSVETVTARAWADYTGAVADGFGMAAAAFGTVFGGDLLDDPLVTGYLVRSAGRVVGSGLGVVAGDAVGVHNIAVVPDRRGRGFGRAVSERVVRDGFAGGATAAFLVSSTEGLPLYRSLGFRQVDTLVRWSTPAPAPAPASVLAQAAPLAAREDRAVSTGPRRGGTA